MDQSAVFKLTYGLFVLTATENGKDNGCIVNTVEQVTTTPNRIAVAVNKANYTHDMIMRTGMFAASILAKGVTFDTFTHFGFQSGKDVDKFADYPDVARLECGLPYITRGTNAVIAGKVINTVDLGTHTMFIADVIDMKNISDAESVTYAYYHSDIKPKPAAPKADEKKPAGWRCKICGYVYEGEDLPADFICPICKHGAADFEKI